jgi:hypothetical protein
VAQLIATLMHLNTCENVDTEQWTDENESEATLLILENRQPFSYLNGMKEYWIV